MAYLAILSKWLPPALWMALIFYLSSMPDLRSDFSNDLDFVLRKIAHVLEYAVLAALLARAWPRRKYLFWEVFAVAALYAASDETHQLFVVGRAGSARDVLIDSIGAFLGLQVYNWLDWRRK